jgi:hypothetical protein
LWTGNNGLEVPHWRNTGGYRKKLPSDSEYEEKKTAELRAPEFRVLVGSMAGGE